MTGPLFFDTNVLIYSLDPSDSTKRATALALIDRSLDEDRLVVSVQSLNECYRVLTGRRQLIPQQAARSFIDMLSGACNAPLSPDTLRLAWTLEDETNYSWWDCLLLASALLAGCTHFLTEDMSDAHEIRGMALVNPFARDLQPLFS